MTLSKQSIFRIPLVREIAIILVIKLVVIFTIKHFFFSNPVDMSNPEQKLMQKFGIAQPDLAPQNIKYLNDMEKTDD